MGVDVELWIKASPDFGLSPPLDAKWVDRSDAGVDATHSLSTLWRYYGRGYERGFWPQIASLLLELFADPEVEKVWYFGDHSDICEMSEFTFEDFVSLSRHWVSVGNEPYRSAFTVSGSANRPPHPQ